MADYVTLLGAEDVRSAGRTIQSAANDMLSAASTIDSALQNHERFLDDWLLRLQEVLTQNAEEAG